MLHLRGLLYNSVDVDYDSVRKLIKTLRRNVLSIIFEFMKFGNTSEVGTTKY